MLFNLLKGFISFSLTALVLFSTMSFSVHKHFCGPFLKDISVIVPSHGCGMETGKTKDLCAVSKEKSCCNDVVELVKGQDDLKLAFNNLDLEKQQFITILTHCYLYSITGDDAVEPSFTAYSPPLVTRDIPVLHQAFLL